MNVSVSIGKYYEENSVVHRLDPRTKIIFTFLFMIDVFLIKYPIVYIAMAGILFALFVASKVPVSYAFQGLKPVFLVLVFALVVNLIVTPGNVIFRLKFLPALTITEEGIWRAVTIAGRLILIVIVSSLMTYTTTTENLTKGLEMLMKPLKVIRVPVHDFATMIALALRFIPILADETAKIKDAQRIRGVNFEEGNLVVRLKKLSVIIIPLFAGAVKKANDLAVAMDARCYNSGDFRTTLKKLKYKTTDVVIIILAVIFCVGFVLGRIFL